MLDVRWINCPRPLPNLMRTRKSIFHPSRVVKVHDDQIYLRCNNSIGFLPPTNSRQRHKKPIQCQGHLGKHFTVKRGEKPQPQYHLYWVLIVRLTTLQSRHNKRIRRRFCMFCPSLACTLALFSILFRAFLPNAPKLFDSLLFRAFLLNTPKLFDNVTCQQLQMGLLSKFCRTVQIQFARTTGH